MILRWFGMMTKKTLPTIIVASMAPVCNSAPRPEKTCWKENAMPMIKAKPTAARAISCLARGDRQSRS